VHRHLVAAFGPVAATYEAARPEYPAGLADHLAGHRGLGPSATVVDVGAGTGKLTRLLADRSQAVIAVEPTPGMAAVLAASVPRAATVVATAERLPLAADTVDLYTAGQAFHWFDPEPAVAEAARVVRPGGWVALIWNTRDESVWPWAEISCCIEPYRGEAPSHRDQERWPEAVAGHAALGAMERVTFPNEQRLPPARVLHRVSTISFIAALSPGDRDDALRRVEAVIADGPENAEGAEGAAAAGNEITLAYETEAFLVPVQ
jgi:SAM-dependent methyltransferase